MIFLTPVGGSGENKHPTTNRTPPQTNKTGPRIERQGEGRVFLPLNDSKPLQRQSEAYRLPWVNRGRNGTHQSHSLLRSPPLAATTHHPSPTARTNHLPTLRSHHHLGHTRPTNQPRSRPYHTRQPGRTQHPRQRANHLQNMQQKQRQQNTTKHSIPTTNHKNTRLLVKKPPTPDGDTPLHRRARPRTA